MTVGDIARRMAGTWGEPLRLDPTIPPGVIDVREGRVAIHPDSADQPLPAGTGFDNFAAQAKREGGR